MLCHCLLMKYYGTVISYCRIKLGLKQQAGGICHAYLHISTKTIFITSYMINRCFSFNQMCIKIPTTSTPPIPTTSTPTPTPPIPVLWVFKLLFWLINAIACSRKVKGMKIISDHMLLDFLQFVENFKGLKPNVTNIMPLIINNSDVWSHVINFAPNILKEQFIETPQSTFSHWNIYFFNFPSTIFGQ